MPKRIYHRFSAPFAAATLVFAAILSVIFTIAYCVNLVSPNSQTVGAGMSSTRSLPIYSVETDEKKIAISFDCAWGVDHTDELLEVMQKNIQKSIMK